MSHRVGASPAGQRWMSRWGVPMSAVLAVLVVMGLVGVAVWASRSPDSPQQANAREQRQPSADASVAATTSPEPSITPSPTSTAQAPPPDTGQPGSQPQPESVTKPVITAFSATANGLMVTVSFTLNAQADRAPFTCSIRRASIGTDEFPCSVGQVSRTYDYDFCCGSEIYVIATDRAGVRSEQWDGWVDFAIPDRPSYSNVEGWHDDGNVYVQFDVTSAPGDDPRCYIDISQFSSDIEYSSDDLPCEGTFAVSFEGPPATYHVTITITSDSHFNPPPGDPQPLSVE